MVNQARSGKKLLPKLEYWYVCSDHFTEDCLIEVDHNLLGGKSKINIQKREKTRQSSNHF